MKRSVLISATLLLMALICPAAHAQSKTSAGRTTLDFDSDWRFIKGDFADALMPTFDDSNWRTLNVPHDWSIEGPLGPQYSSGNGFAPGGFAWYRKHFMLDAAAKDKIVTVEFDGVYDNSEVFINGNFVGGRPYGFSSFECELTPYVKIGDGDNVIAVRVDHSRFADSRFYTGSGIDRNVRLRITDKLHVAPAGIYITTPQVSEASATVQVETSVANVSGKGRSFSVQSEILDEDGHTVASLTTSGNVDDKGRQTAVHQITFPHPKIWSLESPAMYTLKTTLTSDNTAVDDISTPFGIRTIHFDADKGFTLNGKETKLKGVCIHHDAGALGAAVPEKVIERRLRLLKELGVNAVRTSHNPPDPELLDLCDRMGLLVQDEAFDEFTPAKNKWVAGWNVGTPTRFGYAENFKQWSVIDIQDMVKRDRNHPSIIMWSIGNEIDYQNDPFSHPVLGAAYNPQNAPAENLVTLGKPLVDAVHALDLTRPVTAALANVEMSNAVGFADILDIDGYNYQEPRYSSDHNTYPKRVIFGSENKHDLAAWVAARDNPYICGQFLWTGIDYLGEAKAWPSHGNPDGLLDTCGFKKPLAWFRQSLWSDKPMIYLAANNLDADVAAARGGARGRVPQLAESWNWPANSRIGVTCYTNCPDVQLILNDGKPLARHLTGRDGDEMFMFQFEPGVLKAQGLKNGAVVCEYTLKTAGPASRIVVSPDATQLAADGKDVSHLEFQVVDAQGVRIPDGQNELTFDVEGPATILGIDNGDLQSDPGSFQSHARKAFHGRGLAMVQSMTIAGDIHVKVTSPGLQDANVDLMSK
jgi:beta-galactosidase